MKGPLRSKARGAPADSIGLEPIRVRLVAGKPSPRDEDRVATQRQASGPWISREPDTRSAADSPPLGRADRNRRNFEVSARFDFDEGDRAASSGDEVDFASGDHKSPRQDRIALEAKKQRRDRFRLEAINMGVAPALCPFVGASPHRWAPASANARA
jgi:hypothetical protein